MKNINTESTKIDQASKAAIEKADYYAKVAKTATENADKDARVAAHRKRSETCKKKE
jgi:hypothetical protein